MTAGQPSDAGRVRDGDVRLSEPVKSQVVRLADGRLVFEADEQGITFGDVLPTEFAEAFATYLGLPPSSTAIAAVRQLHQPRTETGVVGDCADERCNHPALGVDCPEGEFQVCAHCCWIRYGGDGTDGEPYDSDVMWPCATAELLADDSDAPTIEQARAERDAEWISKLSALCDDDWLRKRDRAMKLPGAHNRHERDAEGAWSHAAHDIRELLPEEAQSDHRSYLAWINGGRDQGAAERCAADGGHEPSGEGYEWNGQMRFICRLCEHAWAEPIARSATTQEGEQ